MLFLSNIVKIYEYYNSFSTFSNILHVKKIKIAILEPYRYLILIKAMKLATRRNVKKKGKEKEKKRFLKLFAIKNDFSNISKPCAMWFHHVDRASSILLALPPSICLSHSTLRPFPLPPPPFLIYTSLSLSATLCARAARVLSFRGNSFN